MILVFIYFILTLVFSAAQEFFMIDDTDMIQSSIFSSNSTECIEICTDQCISDVDVYKCFDDCTLELCSEDTTLFSIKDIEGNTVPYGIILICICLFLMKKLCYNTNRTDHYNYWLI